jgi:hypothetical protein
MSRQVTRLFGRFLAIVFALTSCKTSKVPGHGHLKTDLGTSNSEVAQRFERYKAKHTHCAFDEDADYRVILAGLGPFSGKPVNTSGLIAHNFADFLNHRVNTPVLPTLTSADMDGIVKQDVVTINGKSVSICAVTASVIWDLAGAIYLFEAALFKPDLIIMSGMDGKNDYVGTWESQTKNVAFGMAGYEHDGSESEVTPNTGGGDTLIPIVPGATETLTMSWNPEELAAMANPILSRDLADFSTRHPPEHTPGTYLCNNVSYAVIAGLSGKDLSLAGGMMTVKSPNLPVTKAGFLHYPWLSPPDGHAVAAWTNVMAGAIQSILNL